MRETVLVVLLLGTGCGEDAWSPDCAEPIGQLGRLEHALRAIYVPPDDHHELDVVLPACLPESEVERVLLATSEPLPAAPPRDPPWPPGFVLLELRRSGEGFRATTLAFDLDPWLGGVSDCMASLEECDRRWMARGWIGQDEIGQTLERVRVLLRTRAIERSTRDSVEAGAFFTLRGAYQQLLIEGSGEILDSSFSHAVLSSDDQPGRLPLELAVEQLLRVLRRARWELAPLDGAGRALFDRWFLGLREDALGEGGYLGQRKLLIAAGDHGSPAILPLLRQRLDTGEAPREASEAIQKIRWRAAQGALPEVLP